MSCNGFTIAVQKFYLKSNNHCVEGLNKIFHHNNYISLDSFNKQASLVKVFMWIIKTRRLKGRNNKRKDCKGLETMLHCGYIKNSYSSYHYVLLLDPFRGIIKRIYPLIDDHTWFSLIKNCGLTSEVSFFSIFHLFICLPSAGQYRWGKILGLQSKTKMQLRASS